MVFRLPLVLLGLYKGGLFGAILARFVSDGVTILLNLLLVRQLIGLSLWDQVSRNGRSVAACGVMSTILIGSQIALARSGNAVPVGLIVVFLITAGVATYFATLIWFWRLAGRPQGAETAVMEIVQRAASDLSRKFLKSTREPS